MSKPGILDDVLRQFRGKSADDIAAMIQRRGIKGAHGHHLWLPDGPAAGQCIHRRVRHRADIHRPAQRWDVSRSHARLRMSARSCVSSTSASTRRSSRRRRVVCVSRAMRREGIGRAIRDGRAHRSRTISPSSWAGSTPQTERDRHAGCNAVGLSGGVSRCGIAWRRWSPTCIDRATGPG